MISSVLPPTKSGGGAIEDADDHRHEAGEQADGKRYAPADQDPGQEIAPGIVGAEQKVLLLDGGAHGELKAVGGFALDAGVIEGIGAVEVADDALVDRPWRKKW